MPYCDPSERGLQVDFCLGRDFELLTFGGGGHSVMPSPLAECSWGWSGSSVLWSRLVVGTGLELGEWYKWLPLSVSVTLAEVLFHEQCGPTGLLGPPSAGYWKSFCSHLLPQSDLMASAHHQMCSWKADVQAIALLRNPLSQDFIHCSGVASVWALFKLGEGGSLGTECHSATSKKQKQKDACFCLWDLWVMMLGQWNTTVTSSRPVYCYQKGRQKEIMHVAF